MSSNLTRATIMGVLCFGIALSTASCSAIYDVSYVKASKLDKEGKYEEAFKSYKFVSNSEDYTHRSSAQYRLAEMYLKGEGTKRDIFKALDLYRIVANSSDQTWAGFALLDLGKFYERGIPNYVRKDLPQAAQFYKRSYETGNKGANYWFDNVSRYPEVFVAQNRHEFTPAGEGVAPGGMKKAYSLFKSSNKKGAYRLFLWHAKRGNAQAQANVALFLKGSLGVKKDIKRARAWRYLAAKGGNANAQFNLGRSYRLDQDNFPISDELAINWLSKAADQGHAEAYNLMGAFLFRPITKGRNSEPKKARKMFEKGRALGSLHATVNLGDLYLEGIAVPKDREKAESLYLEAAKKGSMDGRIRLLEKFGIAYQEFPKSDAKVRTKKITKNINADQKKERQAPTIKSSRVRSEKEKAAPNLTGSISTPQANKPARRERKISRLEPNPRPIMTKTPVEIYALLSPSMLKILVFDLKKNAQLKSLGSAVAVTKNLAVTNCHVTEKGEGIGSKVANQIIFLKMVAGDARRDICLLRSDKPLHPVPETRTFRSLRIGERVYAIGSPQGLSNTLSEGLISGKRSSKGIRYIQTSAAISSGSSGGGLFDRNGHLIGITTFKKKGGENLNFAVAIDEALRLLDRYRARTASLR